MSKVSMPTKHSTTRLKPTPKNSGLTLAQQELSWFAPFTKGLEWDPPFAKWFTGGKINASFNCLDRHLAAGLGSKPAIVFEGEPGDERIITYQELHRLVCRFATTLKQLGYKPGDRAIIYMPMIPELPSPCWPARASALRTASSLAASQRKR